MDGLKRLNGLPDAELVQELLRCCGSRQWAEGMLHKRPFRDENHLFEEARRVWEGLPPSDWREAFSHHPRIGDTKALRSKFAATRDWAQGEQAGAASADEETLETLARGNRDYEERFGFIFIVCATGKSAAEMLTLLRARLGNGPDAELKTAAGEQAKITRLRLAKLLAA